MEILERKQEDAPLGWIQNSIGEPTQKVQELKQGGALLPLGSDREHGSHKGYCLGGIVDILSAVLSGANYASWVPPFVSFLPLPNDPVGVGIGHFVGAWRIDGFRPADEFKQHMDNWIDRFRRASTVEGEERVIIPGDPEREMESIRRKEGIPLLEPVLNDLRSLGEKFGVKFEP